MKKDKLLWVITLFCDFKKPRFLIREVLVGLITLRVGVQNPMNENKKK